MVSPWLLGQSLVSGLLIGGVFALIGVGFSLTWGILRVINLAHAAFALLAAYISYWLLILYGIDPLVSLVGIVPLLFFLGVGLHETLIKQLNKRALDITAASVVMTAGLSAVLENTMIALWTSDPRVIVTSYSGKALFVGDISLSVSHLIGFGLAILTIVAVYFFLHNTYIGKAVRAVWQDREGAALSGIDLGRVTAIAYGIAMATAGVGGVALTLVYAFDPMAHFMWLITVFLVVIVGGVGSVLGSAAAGLLVGLIMGISGVLLPFAWLNLVLFSALIVVVLFRPTGLLRR
jgi:branched-chain amino acid transport system permease protein